MEGLKDPTASALTSSKFFDPINNFQGNVSQHGRGKSMDKVENAISSSLPTSWKKGNVVRKTQPDRLKINLGILKFLLILIFCNLKKLRRDTQIIKRLPRRD